MSLWTNKEWTPMLLDEVDTPFDSKDYIFEVKFDGQRALLFIGPNYFKIMNRHKMDITYLFPELENIKELVSQNTIFDGEIIALSNGVPSFSKLQDRSHLKDRTKIKLRSKISPVVFVAFDILYKEHDLTNLLLLQRKKILNSYKENNYFVISKYFKNAGTTLFDNVVKLNLEGIVAKKIESTYSINSRTSDWIKIKNNKEEAFLIGGYEEKQNGLLSLLLGEYVNNDFYYVGRVMLSHKLPLYKDIITSKTRNTSPFINYKKENINYLTPKLNCYVKYMERTKSNHLRQPYIKR